MKSEKQRTCAICGRRFYGHGTKRVCEECEARILHDIEYPRRGICCVCGGPIIGKCSRAKYCSDICKHEADRIMQGRAEMTARKRGKKMKRKYRNFADRVERLGRRAGYNGYGQTMAILHARAQATGRKIQDVLEKLEAELEGRNAQ